MRKRTLTTAKSSIKIRFFYNSNKSFLSVVNLYLKELVIKRIRKRAKVRRRSLIRNQISVRYRSLYRVIRLYL